MKRYLKFLPLAALTVIMISCAPKAVVKEDISSQAAPAAEAGKEEAKGTVVVPEEKVATETITTQNAKAQEAAPKESAEKYSSLGPGDEITKMAEQTGKLEPVHFDFDKYNIRDEDKETLNKDAKWLKLNSAVRVRIEGHADERGDAEYNLALGEKRAESVKKFLEASGIKISRLSTVSYGKEKPVDPGHTEEAWAKNRRAEFDIQK